ncbi:MAG: hypothetical protein ACTSRH_13065 [Promethearchaeota archaeon]
MNLLDLKVRILKALSDPTRIKILESLKDGKELCGCEFDATLDQMIKRNKKYKQIVKLQEQITL